MPSRILAFSFHTQWRGPRGRVPASRSVPDLVRNGAGTALLRGRSVSAGQLCIDVHQRRDGDAVDEDGGGDDGEGDRGDAPRGRFVEAVLDGVGEVVER